MSAVLEQSGWLEIRGAARHSMYVSWEARYNEFGVSIYDQGRRVLFWPHGKLTETRIWQDEFEGLQLAVSGVSVGITQQEYNDIEQLLAGLKEPS